MIALAVDLCNSVAVTLFGIALSAAFCNIHWTPKAKKRMLLYTLMIFCLASIAYLGVDPGFGRYLYPLHTHLPLVLALCSLSHERLWPVISVLTAYLLFLIHISREQHARLRLEELKSNLDLQVHQAVREIEALRISQQKTRAYRHELRHHLQYIAACIENEQYEQALQYIHSISAEIEASRVTVYCENEAANLILSSFADRAKAQHIPLAVHAVLPNQLPLAESDLCVLLSNALENAIHACIERADGVPGHIEVQAYEKAGKFFLQVVNDCTQPVQFSHGVPVSDRAGHGIGVHSICSIVERYGGVYSFSVRNQQFILRISL